MTPPRACSTPPPSTNAQRRRDESVDPRPAAQLRATNIEAVTAELRDALRPVMPAVRACYERALPDLGDPNVNVEVHLTLTGDPDVGS